MRKITVTPDPAHMAYFVKKDENGLYVVSKTIEFFYAELVSESDSFILLKTLTRADMPIDDMYFVVAKSTDRVCNDIYVPQNTPVTLVDDKVVIEIDYGRQEDHIWSGWWNPATEEQISETVLGITSEPDDITVYQSVIKEAYYFLYKSDMRNKILSIYDNETHSRLAEIK